MEKNKVSRLKIPLRKIVSGGQTGVDRAALDAAIFLEIEHGGWCPKGRRAEDGRIDSIYRLQETPETNYSVRTENNVIDSDGTLILCQGRLTGGTKLTKRLAQIHKRPCLVIELDKVDLFEVDLNKPAELVRTWIHDNHIQVLNVAGPRESSCPGIGSLSEKFLALALATNQQ